MTKAQIPDLVNKFARIGFFILAANVLLGVILGLVIAASWNDPPFTPTSWRNLAFLFVSSAYLLAVGLSLPAVPATVRAAAHRDWAAVALLTVVLSGPLFVLLGFEILSHAFIHCDMTPWLCRPSRHDGIIGPPDIFERWHLLHHSLIAAAPLVLCGVALRKWRP